VAAKEQASLGRRKEGGARAQQARQAPAPEAMSCEELSAYLANDLKVRVMGG